VEVGQPISAFRGYTFEGVYQLGEEEEAAIYGRVPGDAKYKDINDDGIISTEDITTIGDGNPDFTGDGTPLFTWKGFDLNTLSSRFAWE
jgi:TonB-dependent starch-binding outer membrane protein SusC